MYALCALTLLYFIHFYKCKPRVYGSSVPTFPALLRNFMHNVVFQ